MTPVLESAIVLIRSLAPFGPSSRVRLNAESSTVFLGL